MDVDTSDILGGSHLQVKPDHFNTAFIFRYLLYIVAAGIVYRLGRYAFTLFREWSEKSYRLSLRRRHGIPDDDHRPFNVAYAALKRWKHEQTVALAKQRRETLAAEAAAQARNDVLLEQEMRQRRNRTHDILLQSTSRTNGAGQTNTHNASTSSHRGHVTFADGYNTSANPIFDFTQTQRSSRKSTGILKSSTKRLFEEADDEVVETENSKKQRMAQHDDEVEDYEPIDQYIDNAPSRGSKRNFGDGEETPEITESRRVREKRQRKVSSDTVHRTRVAQSDDDMDVDKYDHKPQANSRGKKRGRAEAGATFDFEDDNGEEDHHAMESRQKKRRNKRRSSAFVENRGTKRYRDLDGLSEEDEGYASPEASRKKLKKKSPSLTLDDSDATMDTSRSENRVIGETWSVNGVNFKIGPNGQRLRETLVKKERNRFPMPQDSIHPDRRANLQVYVEVWITDEEYKLAKAQNILAWQDSPNPSEPSTPVMEKHEEPKGSNASQHAPGKHLLWESTGSLSGEPFIPPAPITRSNSREYRSVATNLGLYMNPFPSPRRISTVFSSSIAGSSRLADSTNESIPRRTYSKWEKQDLEASAILKVRERRAQAEKARKEKETLTTSGSNSFNLPSITVSKPVESQNNATAASSSGSSLFPPPASTSTGAVKSNVQPSTSTTKAPAVSNMAPPAFKPPSTPASVPDTADKAQSPLFSPKQSEKPKLSGLGFPTPPLTAPAQTITSYGATSKFGFSAPAPVVNKPSETPSVTQPKFTFGVTPQSAPVNNLPSNNPLMSRIGGFASSPAVNDNDKMEESKRTPFVFNKPSAPAPTTSDTQSNTAPKFNFGINSTAPATNPSSSSLSNALNPDTAKSSGSSLENSGDKPAPVKFNFGFTSGGSGQSAVPSNPFGAPKPATVFDAPPAVSSGGPSQPSTLSAPPAVSSAFGVPQPVANNQPVFSAPATNAGGFTSAFSVPKPADSATSTAPPTGGPPKSVFGPPSATNTFNLGMPKPTESAASSAPKSDGPSKSVFGPSAPVFNFGGPKPAEQVSSGAHVSAGSKPSNIFGGQQTDGNKSAFNGSTSQSVFSTGASAVPAATSNAPFTFGSNPENKDKAPASSNNSLFGAKVDAKGTPSIFGGSNGVSNPIGSSTVQSTTAAPTNGFVFGGPTTANGSLFGQPNQSNSIASSSSPFATPAKPNESQPAASTSGISFSFSTKKDDGAPKSGLFGTPDSKSPAFGSTTPAGTPPALPFGQTNNIFAAKPSTGAFVFGANNSQNK